LANQILNFYDVIENIRNVMEKLSGEQVVGINNQICAKKISHISGDLFEYTGKDDNEPNVNGDRKAPGIRE
jgi:hypothetical protein